jgi:hypothetical protein
LKKLQHKKEAILFGQPLLYQIKTGVNAEWKGVREDIFKCKNQNKP